MKIVYVVESLELSGGVKVIVEHADGLAARGHDVAIVTRDARHAWLGVAVPVLEVPVFDARTLPEADVHVATWFPTVVPVVRAARARKVFHFCQGYEAPHPHTLHRLAEIDEAYRQRVPKLLVSAHLEEILAPRYPGPYFVLGQAIPAADFAPADLRRETPRRPPTVGIVGPLRGAAQGDRGRPARRRPPPRGGPRRASLPCECAPAVGGRAVDPPGGRLRARCCRPT